MRIRLAVALLTLSAALLWAGLASADGPLTLEGRTASSLTVSWSWGGQTASGWDLAWRARGDDAAAWRSVRKTAARRRHTIEGLDAGVRYIVRVRALDANDRPFASLQGAFATFSATAADQSLDPRLRRGLAEHLTLDLASSRELCTAGTLTEIMWKISGGSAPYALSVENSAVDVSADNARINCGALPIEPLTGELIARQAKTFRASVSDSRGVTTTAAVTVTLTAPPYLIADTALRYETYDLTGAAASAGSYAFLTDANGAASVVATYEGLRDGSVEGLLINTSDAQGASQRSLYAAVAAGDLFEWRQSYDCWVRYQVTEVKPDPSGAAARKLLAVKRASYAFTGCSGVISTDAVLIAWGSLPDLGGPSLAAPLRHGPFQIIPEGWEGPVEEDPFRPWPGNSYANPVGTADLAEARRLPHWRDPTLPSGWTFALASSGDPSYDPPYGYCAWWATDRGYGGVEICGGFYLGVDWPRESSWSNGGGVVETRMIAGRLAIVVYSPVGANHNSYIAVWVLIYDPIPDTVYHVRGLDGTLRGNRVDAGTAIARSLFER